MHSHDQSNWDIMHRECSQVTVHSRTNKFKIVAFSRRVAMRGLKFTQVFANNLSVFAENVSVQCSVLGGAIVESRRDIPYGNRNLHTFMYFLPTILPCSGRYSGQRVHKSVQISANFYCHMVYLSAIQQYRWG
jgi:hypothetical protein